MEEAVAIEVGGSVTRLPWECYLLRGALDVDAQRRLLDRVGSLAGDAFERWPEVAAAQDHPCIVTSHSANARRPRECRRACGLERCHGHCGRHVGALYAAPEDVYAVAQAVARRVAKEAPEAPADVLRFDPTHFWGLVYGDRDEKRGDEDYRDDAKKPSRDGDGDGDGGGDGDDGFPRDERRPMGSSALSFGGACDQRRRSSRCGDRRSRGAHVQPPRSTRRMDVEPIHRSTGSVQPRSATGQGGSVRGLQRSRSRRGSGWRRRGSGRRVRGRASLPGSRRVPRGGWIRRHPRGRGRRGRGRWGRRRQGAGLGAAERLERGVDFASKGNRARRVGTREARASFSETRWTRRSEDERTTRTSSSDVCVRLVITTIPTSPRFAPRPRLRRENRRSPTVAARRFRASSRLVSMSLVARAVSETRRARYARVTRRCACDCASWADARTRTRTGTLLGGSPRVGAVPRGAPSSRRGIPSPSGRVGAAVNGAAGHLGRLRGRPGRFGARDRVDLERVREHAHRRPTRRGRERRIIQRGGRRRVRRLRARHHQGAERGAARRGRCPGGHQRPVARTDEHPHERIDDRENRPKTTPREPRRKRSVGHHLRVASGETTNPPASDDPRRDGSRADVACIQNRFPSRLVSSAAFSPISFIPTAAFCVASFAFSIM